MSTPFAGTNKTAGDGSQPPDSDGCRQYSAQGSQISGVNLRGTGTSLVGQTGNVRRSVQIRPRCYPTRGLPTPIVGDIVRAVGRAWRLRVYMQRARIHVPAAA